MIEKNPVIEGYIKVSKRLLPGNIGSLVIYRAQGNRLNKTLIEGKTIENGDWLIVDESQKEYNDGDVVVHLEFGLPEAAEVKTEDDMVYLLKNKKPYAILHKAEIEKVQGKVVQVLKVPKY